MKSMTLLSLMTFVLFSMASVEVEAARNCNRDNSCVRNGNRNDGARADRQRNRNRNDGARADRQRNRNRNDGTRADRQRNRNRNDGTRADRDRNRNRHDDSRVNRDRNRHDNRVDRDRRRDRRDARVDRRNRAHRNYRHRPNWNRRNYVYARHYHRPHRYNRTHHRRWSTHRSYHRTVPYRDIYWNRWLRVRVTWNDGYYWHNDYPWYTYNGYRHRYSRVDYCNYELVDGYNNSVERTYYGYTCNTGYDMCADLRDSLNSHEYGYRYFCSEKLEGTYTDYNYNYNDDFYSDVVTYDDGYDYDDGYGHDQYSDWDDDFDSNW